jgi:hypothetical protein
MATDMTVSNTILEHLGGVKMIVMTGASNLLGDTYSLSFRLPSPNYAKSGINYVKVYLTPTTDMYAIEFGKIRGRKYTQIKVHEQVYACDLRRIFTEETGLQVSLGKSVGK